MKITIEKRTNKAGDKQTIRLVTWLGSSTDDTGKIKHNREREQLDQFLYANPQNKLEKQHNKETMQLVEAIRAKRITEAATGKHGFTDASKAKTRFYELFDTLMDEKNTATSKTNYLIWSGCRYQLKQYWPDENLLLSQINVESLKGVRTFFDTQAKTKTGQTIKKATANAYFNKVRSVFKHAFDKGYIQVNLLDDVKTISVGESERTYLTIEQVRRLVETPCRYDPLKRAFLFSCLTGLRWSDIFKLDWSEISQLNGVHRITFNQKKTGGLQYLDITEQAFNLLGTQEKQGRVFQGLRYSTNANVELVRWCMAAGIDKHVTFHAARHTFAVSLLSNGVDIYVVSKLMGHSQVKTTQIYADIIDEVRKVAVHRIPSIGL
jgi:integrase/recombinase XerD